MLKYGVYNTRYQPWVDAVGHLVLRVHSKTSDEVKPGLLLDLSLELGIVLFLPGHIVGSAVCLSRNVNDIKAEPKCFLLKHEKSGVVDICQGFIIQDTQQWFMIHGNYERWVA